MADPTLLTGIIGAGAGVVGAAYGIITGLRERAKEGEKEAEGRAATSLANWSALNEALQREIQRRDAEMVRLRADYETRLDAAHQRITELETEVGILQRALSSRPPG
jgi:hypothetical protein